MTYWSAHEWASYTSNSTDTTIYPYPALNDISVSVSYDKRPTQPKSCDASAIGWLRNQISEIRELAAI